MTTAWRKQAADETYAAGWHLRETGSPVAGAMIQMAGAFLKLEVGDTWGCADSFGHLSISAKHAAQRSTDPTQETMAIAMCRGFAKTAYLIAEAAGLSPDQLAILLHKEADATMLQGEYQEAAELYQRVIDLTAEAGVTPTDGSHGNRLCHLGHAKFKSGQKAEGLQLINEGMRLVQDGIIAGEPTNMTQLQIWLTGCMMTKARCLAEVNQRDDAISLAREARDIIEEKNLTVRKEQVWELLEELEI
ncbi:MAG: hypothetical protein FJ044_03145 [Candidatus Cloacimonetes bacterium]|nr:hypothetical protein [Candidatus Cloacimonadota bacterium]